MLHNFSGDSVSHEYLVGLKVQTASADAVCTFFSSFALIQALLYDERELDNTSNRLSAALHFQKCLHIQEKQMDRSFEKRSVHLNISNNKAAAFNIRKEKPA